MRFRNKWWECDLVAISHQEGRRRLLNSTPRLPMTPAMAIQDAVARVSELEAFAASPAPSLDPASDTAAFPAALADATAIEPLLTAEVPQLASVAAPQVPAAGANGTAVLAAAESQVGVAEEPPGSNDGPQIALYRSAVAGAAAGEPWCAQFVSWCAAQAGTPIGAAGEGASSVAEIAAWAQQTGRLLPAGVAPEPGDLILFGDRHVGIVESVAADGSLTTIEGNYANGVARVHRSPAEATGYVRLSA